MKTNMLILSLMISAAAAAQNTTTASNSSTSDLTVKKSGTSVTGQGASSLETATKNNKISGEASLRDQVALNRQISAAQNKSTGLPAKEAVKPKADKSISATEKEKGNLIVSTSKLAANKQTESTRLAKSGIKTGKAVKGSVQSKASAQIKTSEATTASLRKSAKTSVSKIPVKPRQIKVNTQIRTVTAVKIR